MTCCDRTTVKTNFSWNCISNLHVSEVFRPGIPIHRRNTCRTFTEYLWNTSVQAHLFWLTILAKGCAFFNSINERSPHMKNYAISARSPPERAKQES